MRILFTMLILFAGLLISLIVFSMIILGRKSCEPNLSRNKVPLKDLAERTLP